MKRRVVAVVAVSAGVLLFAASPFAQQRDKPGTGSKPPAPLTPPTGGASRSTG